MTDSQILRPNNLPIPVTSFVGPDAEVAEVTRLLTRTRLLTLTGTGAAARRGWTFRWPPNCYRTMPKESG